MEFTAYIIYLFVIVAGVFLFGAVHTYAYTLMTLGTLAATLLVAFKAFGRDGKTRRRVFRLPRTPFNIGFLLLLLFLTFQLTPLPPSVVSLISPETLAVKATAVPLTLETPDPALQGEWIPLVAYPYPVRLALLRWVVYGLFFFGFSRVLITRKRIDAAVILLLMLGCFEALYGLGQAYSGSGHILWWEKEKTARNVTGTYINRNHFAWLMEIGVLLAICFAAGTWDRVKSSVAAPGGNTSFRARMTALAGADDRMYKHLLVLFSGVVMAVSLVLSGSRGGLLGMAAGMLCLGVLFVVNKRHRAKGWILLGVFVVAALYGLHIGLDYPLKRLTEIKSAAEQRNELTLATLELFEDYPVFGVGLGGFAHAYPRYQPESLQRDLLWHAHNDWAQFLAEGGATGMALLIVGVAVVIYRTLALWRRRQDAYAVCLGAMPLAAFAAFAVHSYTDFNLHVPANVLLVMSVMAIGHAALHSERHRGHERSLYRYFQIPLRYGGGIVFLVIVGLVVWTGFWSIRHFVAEAYCNTVRNSTLNRDPYPPMSEIDAALSWDSENAAYWYKRAEALWRMRDRRSEDWRWMKEEFLPHQRRVVQALEQALSRNPFSPEYRLRLGWELQQLGMPPYGEPQWLLEADRVMQEAVPFVGYSNPDFHVSLGDYWVMRSKQHSPETPEWAEAWNRACDHYQKSLALESDRRLGNQLENIMERVWAYYPDEAFVAEAVGVPVD